MLLKLKDVNPNPFRDLKGNPLIEDKIEELMSSIKLTGYWQNVVVTKRQGKWVLAYGHHRWEAARRCGIAEADFIVMELDDAKLIQVLDNENRETYASSPASIIESVRAVVAALAEGSIPPFDVDPSTRITFTRRAPSFAPFEVGQVLDADRSKLYTALHISQMLGRTRMSEGKERPTMAVDAALDFLCLQELGKINKAVLVKDKQPITVLKLSQITTDIKQRHEREVVRQGKTAAELEALRAKQLAAQAKAKADEKAAEEAHKALVKKLADAQREENERKADALAKQIKDNDARAKEKEALNKVRMKELDKQLAAKKEWEAQQVVQDAYMPIRRDVEAMIGKLERTVSESNPFREDVKSLSTRKGLKPEDKLRLRKAAMAVSDWYGDWVAPQFAPEMKATQKRTAEARKATLHLRGKENA